MKLEKGMYVRVFNTLEDFTEITQIEELFEDRDNLEFKLKQTTFVDNREREYSVDDVIKASYNIIDLIEVGDVIEINNEKYEVIYDTSYAKLGLLIPNREHLSIRHCSLEYIVSNLGRKEFGNINIVTKEQFEEMEYKI